MVLGKFEVIHDMSIKHRFARIKDNQEARTLISNFSYLTLLQIAGYVFPLFTLPYLARVIGTDGFGKLAFASAIIVWFTTIADWGFNFTSTRDVAQNRDNIKKISEIFSTVLYGRIILCIATFALLLLLIFIIPKFKENALLIILTFLQIPGNILFPVWLFQGLERMKYTTLLNLLVKLVFALSIFIFINKPDDYIYQPIITATGFLLSGIISTYIIICKWHIKIIKIPVKNVLNTIKSNTDIFINNIMPNFYNSFSVALLGFIGTDAMVGIYDAGKKFMHIAYQFMSIISRTFFPYLARKHEKFNLFERFYLIIGLFTSITLFFCSPILIKLFYGDPFIESITILQIVSVSIFFIAMQSVYGTNYLLIKRKEKTLRNITLISSSIGFIIAFPLIFYFKAIGTALTYTISSLILGLLSMIYAKKYNHINNSTINKTI